MPSDAPREAPILDDGAPLPWGGASDMRSYYRLYFAYVTGLFATGIAVVALTLVAFDLAGDDSPAVIGTALSLKMLAFIFAAPVSAALTERLPRKPLLIALDLVRAGSLAFLLLVEAVWQIYVLVFVASLASASFVLVYQSVVPYLLRTSEDYTLSLTRSRVANELESSISPLMAAGLLLLIAPGGIFIVAAIGFLGSAALVLGTDLPRTRARHELGLWEKVLRGPKLFLMRPELRGLLALDVAVAAATATVMVNTVVLVQGVHDLDRQAVAFAFAAFGLGSIAGALILPRFLRRLPDRAPMLAGSVLLTSGLLVGILLSSYPGLLCLWFLIGLGVSLTLTPALYMIRRISTPLDLQTLLAAQFSISNVLMVAAYAVAGWLAVVAGPWATAFLLGIVAAGASLVAFKLWPPERGGERRSRTGHALTIRTDHSSEAVHSVERRIGTPYGTRRSLPRREKRGSAHNDLIMLMNMVAEEGLEPPTRGL